MDRFLKKMFGEPGSWREAIVYSVVVIAICIAISVPGA